MPRFSRLISTHTVHWGKRPRKNERYVSHRVLERGSTWFYLVILSLCHIFGKTSLWSVSESKVCFGVSGEGQERVACEQRPQRLSEVAMRLDVIEFAGFNYGVKSRGGVRAP